MDERTILPSARRLAEARRSGSVPRSRDLTFALVALTMSLALLGGGATLWGAAANLMQVALSAPAPSEGRIALDSIRGAIVDLAWAAAVPLAVICATAIAGNALQFGLMLTPAAVRPQWRRISPGGGFGRLTENCRPGSVLPLLLKLACVTVLVTLECGRMLRRAGAGTGAGAGAASWTSIEQTASGLGTASVWLAVQLSVALLVLSVIDLAVQRYRYREALRMTEDEAKEEARMTTGTSRRAGDRAIPQLVAVSTSAAAAKTA